MSIIERVFDAQLSIFGQPILWREIVGNGFRVRLRDRRAQAASLGVAGRDHWQRLVVHRLLRSGLRDSTEPDDVRPGWTAVFFVITSFYGWWRWSRIRAQRGPMPARSLRVGPRRPNGSSTSRSGLSGLRSHSGCSRRSAPAGPRRAGTTVRRLDLHRLHGSRPTRWPGAGTTSGWHGSPLTSSGFRCWFTHTSTPPLSSSPFTADCHLWLLRLAQGLADRVAQRELSEVPA